jgi:LytS/YehU family sensor histidine kinase
MNDAIAAAADFSLGQTLFSAAIVYFNLFILIPKLLKNYGKTAYIIGVFGTLLLFSFLVEFSGLYELLNDLDEEFNNSPSMDLFSKILSYSIEFSLFMIISFLYWYFTKHQEEEKKALQFQNEKLQAELQLLKSQISPHFLFNSLNNIYSLSILNDPNASVMIEKLSDILRYIIYEGNNTKVGLQAEVEMLENYIQLQLLRKLKSEEFITYKITGDFSNKKIAPLLLINIIENCFKHSNVETIDSGFLEINISEENYILTLETKNTFTPNTKKKGIGMQNLKHQLQHIYPNAHSLSFDNKNGTFDLKLTIELNS